MSGSRQKLIVASMEMQRAYTNYSTSTELGAAAAYCILEDARKTYLRCLENELVRMHQVVGPPATQDQRFMVVDNDSTTDPNVLYSTLSEAFGQAHKDEGFEVWMKLPKRTLPPGTVRCTGEGDCPVCKLLKR
jgi:hypothetical protein